jgi:DNA-binding NarL/FixJ family response regulator
MATAVTDARSPIATVAVGACMPVRFEESKVRGVLTRAGHSLEFWQESPEQALAAAAEHSLDLMLIGARRPDAGALKCVLALQEVAAEARVILICERSGDGDLRKALDAGVSGFVTLAEVESALPPVIDVVLAGQISVPGSRGKELRKQILTPREKQILGLVVMGMTNAEIASKLFLAESTIKSHLSSAFAKLGVSSRSEAASLILDPRSGAGLGILTIPTG